jgi:hypothetical protein
MQSPPPTDSYYDEDRLDENEQIASCLLGCISIPHVLRNKNELRSGKWTKEEEQFAFTIIQHFQAGTLCIPETATLRQCLSVALNCDAMRISKKFAGPYSIGKQVFTPLDKNHANFNIMKSVCAEELNIARSNWFRKLDEMDVHSFGRSRKRVRLDGFGRELFSSSEVPATILTEHEGAELEMLHKALIGLDKHRDYPGSGEAPHGAAQETAGESKDKVGFDDGKSGDRAKSTTGVVGLVNDEKIPQVIAKIEKILRGEFSTTPSVLHLQAQMHQMQQSYLQAAQTHQEIQQRVLMSSGPAAMMYANTMAALGGAMNCMPPPAHQSWTNPAPFPSSMPPPQPPLSTNPMANPALNKSGVYMSPQASAIAHATMAAQQQQSMYMSQSMGIPMASQMYMPASFQHT